MLLREGDKALPPLSLFTELPTRGLLGNPYTAEVHKVRVLGVASNRTFEQP
jgi:hypothetical protein